jgi:hypothetical protein
MPNLEELTGGVRILHKLELQDFFGHQITRYFQRDHIKEFEMGETCKSIYEKKKCVDDFDEM